MNRRTFVATCGAAAAVPGLALAAKPDPAAAGTDLPVLGGRFSSQLFEAYRDEVFRLSGDGAPSATLRLSEVMEESGPGRLEQFSLCFEPVQGDLPSEDGLFLLEHPQGGKIALALQPVKMDGCVRSLTASFSLIG